MSYERSLVAAHTAFKGSARLLVGGDDHFAPLACELVGVYADRGISGTSVKKREQFLKLIDDCRAGKIDGIITKSVSRFG
ncbi:MAG: recombinase family protein, partial [Bacteroidales bacterium]|nr:recombinase family protein [Bacteroidales bacterium]